MEEEGLFLPIFAKTPTAAVFTHFRPVRDQLTPLVTSLWKRARAPIGYFPILLAIKRIASNSAKPKTWLKGLNKAFTTDYSITEEEESLEFSDLFKPLDGKKKESKSTPIEKKATELDLDAPLFSLDDSFTEDTPA